MYFPMRRALSLAKNGAWYLSHIDDAVMAEFLMAPVIIPSGLLHMWPEKNNKWKPALVAKEPQNAHLALA